MTPDEFDQLVALVERRTALQLQLEGADLELLQLRGKVTGVAVEPVVEPRALPPAERRVRPKPDAKHGTAEITDAVLALMAEDKDHNAPALVAALDGKYSREQVANVLCHQYSAGTIKRTGRGRYRLAKKA